MANILDAIRACGPRLKLSPTVRIDRLAKWIAMRTGANKGDVLRMSQEFTEAIHYFNSQGMPVKLEGIGIFMPSIDRKGNIKINFRPDSALKKIIKDPADYVGIIQNKSNIGLDNEGYKELWDELYPDNPLDINTNGTSS